MIGFEHKQTKATKKEGAQSRDSQEHGFSSLPSFAYVGLSVAWTLGYHRLVGIQFISVRNEIDLTGFMPQTGVDE